MDISQLRAFLKVARHGSFSLAARELGLTQSGISRQVQQIEHELGLALVDREQRPVRLTRAGKELLPCAERIVNDLDATIQTMRAGRGQLTGYISVAASTIPGEFYVPDLLARFAARYPGVQPSLVITDSAGVADELLARRAEVGFLGANLAHNRLELTPFADDEIVLIAPASHALAKRLRVSLDELAGQPFVEREGGSGTLESLKRLLAGQGLTLPEHHVAMIAGTSQAQLAAIEAGVGLGFVSSMVLTSRPNLKVVRIELDGLSFRRTLYLAHERAPLSPIAQAFVRFVTG